MNKQDILNKSRNSTQPMIVEFWAPWCTPCKLMAPALEKTAKNFTGRVVLLRVNADEDPQAVKEFGIMGIPAMVVLSGGEIVSRHTGLLNANQLDALFTAVSSSSAIIIPPTGFQRTSRVLSGLALAAFGYIWGNGLILYPFGAILVFSAFYDRCPVFRMIFPRVKSFFRRNVESA